MLFNRKVKALGAVLLTAVLIANSIFTWGALYEIMERQTAFEKYMIYYLNEPDENLNLGLEVHVTMRHYRGGVLIGYSHHAGVLTTAGQDWIEDQLGDTPSANPAKWIGLSNNAGAPNAGWTEIPDEITTGNMSRSAATYTSTGVGTWNQTFIFNPTETNSTRLIGVYYAAAGVGLLYSDTIAVVNYQATDTLEIECSQSVT